MLLSCGLNSTAVRHRADTRRHIGQYQRHVVRSPNLIHKSNLFTRPVHLLSPRAQRNEEIQRFEWRWEESDDALRAYSALFACLLGGSLLPLAGLRYADLAYFTGLAICTIYIGAHRGLSSKLRTTITFKQGLLAPVACSVALLGGYLLIKFFPDLSLSTILNAYFWLLGSVAVSGALAPVARQLVR